MLVSPRRTAVIVRERIHGEPRPGDAGTVIRCGEGQLDRELAAARSWPLDFLELLITRRESEAEVRLRCGRWGTAPVYLMVRGATLRADWDVARLYPFLRSSRLDPVLAAWYLLELGHPYSRRTLFPGVWMLTERATASWSAPPGDLTVDYPRPERHARAQRLGGRVRVTATFREILSTSMRRWVTPANGPMAVELSGGLDSSIVAATAAGIRPGGVRSYGMLMPGRPGGHQRARRDEVVRRFRLLDRARRCTDHPPFHPGSRRVRGLAVVPWGEFYEEAVGAMLEHAASDGARLIFTGLGGDELCSYQPGEIDGAEGGEPDREDGGPVAGAARYPSFVTTAARDAYEARGELSDDAPQALLEDSALESAAAVSTLHLRTGVWPANPLCTPDLVEFCRQLPLAWRHERAVERKVLRSLGCSPTVANPRPEHLETFNEVMEGALRHASSAVIRGLFRDSRLADQGLVDRDRLLAAYARYRRGEQSHAEWILGAVVLELTLRSLERARAPRSANTGFRESSRRAAAAR